MTWLSKADVDEAFQTVGGALAILLWFVWQIVVTTAFFGLIAYLIMWVL